MRKSRSSQARHPQGFALIVSISLLLLLAVIAIGFLTLAATTQRRTGQLSHQQIAQQNARFALMVALGELQEHLGPDTRASARASVLATDPRLALSIPSASARAWWTGVSHSDGSTQMGSDSKDVVWLLSGLLDGDANQPLHDPVALIGAQSLDLATHTGGEALQAGRVFLKESDGTVTGAYAWIVDDEGTKAQLAPSDPRVHNEELVDGLPLSAGLLATTSPLDLWEDMDTVSADDREELQKLGSLGELRFLDASPELVRDKFFSYTTRSTGVLADTRLGGLKKDLTIAFEKPSVFSQVFPESDPEKYLLVDHDKQSDASDLTQYGYINWSIFRDYYNLKKHIELSGGTPYLQMTTFLKHKFLNGSGTIGTANWPPHQLKEDQHPYGSPTVYGNGSHYVRNPILPILSNLQQNVWLEYHDANGTTPAKLTTHAQLWFSEYNPYNIAVRAQTDSGSGPRLIKYPEALVSVEGAFTRLRALHDKLQAHAPGNILLKPGTSQIFGFARNRNIGAEVDDQSMSENIQGILNESAIGTVELTGPLVGDVNFQVEFTPQVPALSLGSDQKGGDYEVSSAFFTPFARDQIPAGGSSVNNTVVASTSPTNMLGASLGSDRPGITLSKTFSPNDLKTPPSSIDRMLAYHFSLRTTREPGSALRPLIDANLRAQWNNPRWDAGLGLDTVATHTLVNNGQAEDVRPEMSASQAPKGFTFLGNSRGGDGSEQVILFDVPRRDLVSLGQLQHAAAGRFSYEPSYVVGNSYANPRLPLSDWKTSASDNFSTPERGLSSWKINGNFNLYDASYLSNEVLWDSYIFTTIPQEEDNFTDDEVPADFPALLARDLFLPNPRFIPYEPAGSSFDQATLQDTGTSTSGSFFHNAGHLLVDGAFNVNSTSIDAWEAFLSGTFTLPVGKMNAEGRLTGFTTADKVRFPRAASHLGEGMDSSSIDDNFWTGFRELEQDEVRALATAIVAEIQKRGPALTLADFVNRDLANDETGKSGILQAALDQTINQGLDSDYGADADSASYPHIPAGNSQAAGFPGQLLQGDLLQALSPYMTVHSDTFTIRAYGESRQGDTIHARAYCEATVQRYPDPVPTAGSASPLAELANPSSPFGRRFRLQSFRWLKPSEI